MEEDSEGEAIAEEDQEWMKSLPPGRPPKK